MSVLESVLKEECKRLETNVEAYHSLLNNLPRGTIFVRKMHNKSFVYRRKKVNGKVVSEYLGSLNSKKACEGIALSAEYKRIKANLKIAKFELSKIKKAVSIYD